MATQVGRTLRIFWLAAGLFRDYRRIRRIDRKWEGLERKERMAAAYSRAGSRVRKAAFALQGLIVKVGQFLSARTDVLPAAFTRELSQLQDEVPAAPFEPVAALLRQELAADVADLFPVFAAEPIAAASLGQVYRAQLADGTEVAVKVLRPGIEQLAQVDLSALRKVVRLLQRFTRFGKRMNVWQLYREFSAMVTEELNYVHEADNLRRFAADMSSDPRIAVPRVHEGISTRRVLVMEYMDGVKITDTRQITQWHVDRDAVVRALLDSYLRQLLDTGLIHDDPHPGNLYVMPDGRLCFLDFGMMTDLPKADARLFARLVQSLLQHDFAAAVQAVDDLGFLQPHADRAFLQRALAFMLDRFNGVQLHASPELDAFLDEFNEFLRDEPIQLPAKYMFLGRALGMAIGVINSLAPDTQWSSLLRDRALPFVAKLGGAADQPTARWLRPLFELVGTVFGENAAEGVKLVANQATELAQIGLRLPGRLDRTLDKLENGNIQVRLQLDDVLWRIDAQQRLFTRLVWLGFSAAAGLAAAWLQHQHWMWQADTAWVLTGVGLLVWFWSWIPKSSRGGHHPGPQSARERHERERSRRREQAMRERDGRDPDRPNTPRRESPPGRAQSDAASVAEGDHEQGGHREQAGE